VGLGAPRREGAFMATPKSKKVKKKVIKGKGTVPSSKKKLGKEKKMAKSPLIKRRTEKTPPKALVKMEEKKEIPKVEMKKEVIPEATLEQDKEFFKKILLDMKQKLIEEISESRFSESLVPSADIGDIIDQAGDERERELSLLLTSREKEKLSAINEALEKIEEGTYGICEECGEKIGLGRLKAMPLAKFCVSCQSKFEEEQSIQKRTEEDLTYRGLAFATGLEEEES
jgi:DnaK suppressor protein